MAKLEGIITPTLTPISGDNLDYDAVDSLMDFLDKIGVNGIFPMGTTGAFAITSVEFQVKILEYFMEKKKENMFFLAGVGRNSLDETMTMATFAKELGSDAISVVTPYYHRMDQESLYMYYDSILSKIDIPVVIYNIPQNTNNSIDAETIRKLRNQYSHLIGIKDSSGNFSRFSEYIYLLDKDFSVIQGQDDLLLPSLLAGAKGGICGTSNFSNLSTAVYSEFKNGNIETAKKMQVKLSKLKISILKYPFPQAYMALFSQAVYKKDVSTIFPLRGLNQEEKASLLREVNEFLQ